MSPELSFQSEVLRIAEPAAVDSVNAFLADEEGRGELLGDLDGGLQTFQIELVAEEITDQTLQLRSDVGVISHVSGKLSGHVDQIVHREEGGSEAGALLVHCVQGAEAVVGLRLGDSLFDLTDEANREIGGVGLSDAKEADELADGSGCLSSSFEAVAKISVAVFIVEAVLEATNRGDGIITITNGNGVAEGASHGNHAIRADLTEHGEPALDAAVTIEGDLQGEAGKVLVVVDDEAFGAEWLQSGVEHAILVGDGGIADHIVAEVTKVDDAFGATGEADGAARFLFEVDVDHLRAVDGLELVEHFCRREEAEDAVGLADEAEHRITHAIGALQFHSIDRDAGGSEDTALAIRRGVGDGGDGGGDGLDGGDAIHGGVG